MNPPVGFLQQVSESELACSDGTELCPYCLVDLEGRGALHQMMKEEIINGHLVLGCEVILRPAIKCHNNNRIKNINNGYL